MTAATITRDQDTARDSETGQETMTTAARQSRRPLSLRATRSEAKRLNRRSFAGVGLGLLVLFAIMTTAVTFLAGDEAGRMMQGAIDLTSAEGLVAGLVTGADMFGIVALALWAAATASDYTTGWVRVLVQAEPRRWHLYGGKLLALAAYTVVGTAAAALVSVAAAPLFAGVGGISTAAWETGAVTTVLSTWANVTLSVLAWGVIGVAVATVTRSVTAAIAGGIGYMMVFEGLLGLVFDTGVTTYFPGSVLSAVASGGTASLAYGSALLLGLGYAAAAIVIAGVVFARRDITS